MAVAPGTHSPAPGPRAEPRAQPLEAVAGFATLLREHGFRIGIAEQQAMVLAALRVPRAQQRPEHLAHAWRAIACHGARDWRAWPDLFERYWMPERQRGSTRVSGQTRPSRDLRQLVLSLQQQLADPPAAPGARAMDTALDAPGAVDTDEATDAPRRHRGGASRTEALHDRSLHEWLPQDLQQLRQLADRIAQQLRQRLTRRWHDDVRGRRLDLRRTLRASLATGGMPLQPAWRRPRQEPPQLFILVDVSRSIDTHAQLFLRVARAFVQAAQARAFVFHTRLAEVTPLLQRDSAAVQEKVNAATAGFAGGTRIATAVADFRRVHARAQLGRRAQVWLMSDGFDADAPERLAEELAALARRGVRVSWFHPAPQPPASAAVQAARGHIHRFVPLASLRDLARAAPRLD